jgi:hypothetical protein
MAQVLIQREGSDWALEMVINKGSVEKNAFNL